MTPFSGSSIADLTHKCLELLSVPIESMADQLDTHRERFESWTRSSGALQSSMASLDYRLRNHERIKLTILELLDLIVKALIVGSALSSKENQGTTSVNSLDSDPQRFSLPESSEISTQSPKTKKPVANKDWIGKAIDELVSLNMTIMRASGPYSRFKLPSNWPRLDQNIEPYFGTTARAFLRSSFGATIIRPSLVNHLADSISRRRKRLLYQWQHERRQREGKQPSILRKKDEEFTGWKQSSTVSTDVDITHLYPSLPSFEERDGRCLCLFCPEILEMWEKSEEARLHSWRQHVDKHVEPYICLSEDCSKPPLFFNNVQSWSEHMTLVHNSDWTRHVHSTVWFCDQHDSELEFRDVEDFKAHVMDSHRSLRSQAPPNQAQVLLLTKQKCRQELRDPQGCPMCESQPPECKDSWHDSSVLEKHIAGHLKYLALATVPDVSGTELPDSARVTSIWATGEADNQYGQLEWTRNDLKTDITSSSDDDKIGKVTPLEMTGSAFLQDNIPKEMTEEPLHQQQWVEILEEQRLADDQHSSREVSDTILANVDETDSEFSTIRSIDSIEPNASQGEDKGDLSNIQAMHSDHAHEQHRPSSKEIFFFPSWLTSHELESVCPPAQSSAKSFVPTMYMHTKNDKYPHRAPSSYASSSFAPSSYAPSSYVSSSFASSSFAPSSYAPSSYAPSSYAPSSYAPSSYTTSSSASHYAVSQQQPPLNRQDFPCEFLILTGCTVSYQGGEAREWKEHHLAHLNSNFPAKLGCWFCDTFIFDANDHQCGGDKFVNFERRMQHIRDHIIDEGCRTSDMRPDGNLIRHLRRARLVSSQEYDEILRRLTPLHIPILPRGWQPPLEQVQEEPASSSQGNKKHKSSKEPSPEKVAR